MPHDAATRDALDRAARLQARSDAWGTTDLWDEARRRAGDALGVFVRAATEMQELLADEALYTVLDQDSLLELDGVLLHLVRDAKMVAREHPASKRERGAPHSWRPMLEDQLRQLGLSRQESRKLLKPDALRKHWQKRKRSRKPGGTGIEVDGLWCDNHPLGCPPESLRSARKIPRRQDP
jgi:hypothetical protein